MDGVNTAMNLVQTHVHLTAAQGENSQKRFHIIDSRHSYIALHSSFSEPSRPSKHFFLCLEQCKYPANY